MHSAYVWVNGHFQLQFLPGGSVPNSSSRFTEFAAGKMIVSKEADEAVVTQRFTEEVDFKNPADAIGKTIEFLAAPKEAANAKSAEEEPPSFFGLPLGQDAAPEAGSGAVVAKTFRIAGVLNSAIKEGAGHGGVRGLLPVPD